MKQKRKLRIFISNTFYPAKEPGEGGAQEEGSVASWELRVEGRLLEDNKNDPNKVSKINICILFNLDFVVHVFIYYVFYRLNGSFLLSLNHLLLN